MPTYRYYCDNCQTEFEKFLSFEEQTDTLTCPNGHVKARRLFTPPTIIFKGQGWYSTDHPKKGNKSND